MSKILLEVIKKVNEDEENANTGFVQFSNELNNVLIELDINPLVYIALKRHENSRTKKCYPSYDMMARETGLSKATVIKHIKLLVKYDLIKKNKKKGKNYYTLIDLEELKKTVIEDNDDIEIVNDGKNDKNIDNVLQEVNEEFLSNIYTFNNKTFKAEDWQKVLNEKEIKDFYFNLNDNEQKLFEKIYQI